MNLKGRRFLTLLDFTPAEIIYLLDLAAELKTKKKAGIPHQMCIRDRDFYSNQPVTNPDRGAIILYTYSRNTNKIHLEAVYMIYHEGIKKIVLAYSGGLDTSIIIPWLKENYNNPEIIAVAGNVGQADELEGLEAKAIATGASKLIVADLVDEMVDEDVYKRQVEKG